MRASALAAAHAAGIVHRDVKPENIMVRGDDYIKVLDFGVAKLTERPATDLAATTRVLVETDTGMVIGTTSYMSPEQTRGLPVDARTDTWSLGVVLYEMVARRAPFSGSTPSDVIVEILDREPAPLPALDAGELPAELERIVRKALRKDREERYQTVKDMALDLKSLRRDLEVGAEMERSVPPALRSGAAVAGSGGQSAGATVEEPTSSTGGSRHSTPTVENLVGRIKRHKIGALLGLAIIVMAVAGAVGLYRFWGLSNSRIAPAEAFQRTKVTKLTTNGNARSATISPDGKYVAYTMEEGGKQSLWVRQVAIASNIRLLPLADAQYYAMAFSPDSNYVYYIIGGERPSVTLYKVPVLGGSSTKVIEDLKGPGSLSPDGKQVAMVNSDSKLGESELSISNIDGTGKKRLAVLKYPGFFGWSAWSPDGKIIACSTESSDASGSYANVIEVRVADGAQKPISSQRWLFIDQMAWLSDGSGLVMSAQDPESSFWQIWHVSYPGGQARKITNDLSDYYGMSLSADSRALVTLQTQRLSTIWISPKNQINRPTQVTPGVGTYYDLSWTPDGHVLYASDASGSADIWEMEANGTGQKQLTAGAGRNYAPSVSPDGRYIVFHSNRSGAWQIWRMDRDGSNPIQLTTDNSDSNWPEVSPDGRWVVYHHLVDSGNAMVLWKVPVEGGTPVRITEKLSMRPTVSPDGKLIACWQESEQPNRGPRIAVIPLAGGQPVKTFDITPTTRAGWDAPLRWTPDGKALTYMDQRGGIGNIWSQPFNGGKPVQLTNFKDNLIFSFAWSRDFKLAISRGVKAGDAVLITDAR